MPQFDVEAARKAGYSDDEILSHLTATRKFDVAGAVTSGYSKAEIIDHLSTTAPRSHGATGSFEEPAKDYSNVPILGPLARFGRAAAETAASMITTPYHAIVDEPQTPEEFAAYAGGAASGVGGRAGLAAARLTVLPQIEQAKLAADKSRPTVERVGRGLAAATPVVGPMAAGIADTAVNQGIPEALGQGAVMALAPKVIEEASPVVRRGAEAARNLPAKTTQAVSAKVQGMIDRPREPIPALTQALKPLATNIGFKDAAERAIPRIKEAEAELGRPIQTVEDFHDATKLAKKQVWGEYEQIAGPKAAYQVDASSVADRIEKSVSLKTKIQNPAAVEKIQAIADTYRRPYTLAELDDLLSTSNAELESYYAKYPAARSKAQRANPDIAQNVAEAEGLRDLIYKRLDEGGTAARDLKRTYGSLMNMEKEAQRRLNVAARQNPDSLSEQLSRWEAAMRVGKAAVTFPARPIGALGDLASAYAGRKVATAIKTANTSDALIANVFRNYQAPSRGVNLFEQMRRQPAGFLGPGAIPMGATPDASFVRGIPAQAAVSGRPRLLTQGARPMPPAPDTSFVRGTAANLGSPAMNQFPKNAPLGTFGKALTEAHKQVVMDDMVRARMAQIRDIFRSADTDLTGKGLRDETGAVVKRGAGVKYNVKPNGDEVYTFPELKHIKEGPSAIAAAIERGEGPLYERIEKAIRDALPETLSRPADIEFGFGANIAPYRATAWDTLKARLQKKP